MVPLLLFMLSVCTKTAGFRVGADSPLRKPAGRALGGTVGPPYPVSDEVTVAGVRGNSGLVKVLEDGSSMFYWFVEKLGGSVGTDNSPLIVWLQGGPGCTSMFGHLFEFGPLYIDGRLGPQRRGVTWASEAHLLFIDNPLGTGYSFAARNEYVRSEEEMARNLYAMMQELCLRHSEWFSSREVYIFGESYAGKYIPHISTVILSNNRDPTSCFIPLAGIGLGNGWVSPLIQTMSMANYSYAAGIIEERERREADRVQKLSLEAFAQGRLGESNSRSIEASDYIVSQAGGVNMYNVRQYTNYDFSPIVSWLSLPSTKQLLHVPVKVPFLECGIESYYALDDDEMLSVTDLLPPILSQIKVLVYTGQDDLLCNVLGTKDYLATLPLPAFHSAPSLPWMYSGQHAGYIRSGDNLTQIIVLDAGHMVPLDQPERSIGMLRKFIYG